MLDTVNVPILNPVALPMLTVHPEMLRVTLVSSADSDCEFMIHTATTDSHITPNTHRSEIFLFCFCIDCTKHKK